MQVKPPAQQQCSVMMSATYSSLCAVCVESATKPLKHGEYPTWPHGCLRSQPPSKNRLRQPRFTVNFTGVEWRTG
eukprot:1904094-Amphidinium_carterae.1